MMSDKSLNLILMLAVFLSGCLGLALSEETSPLKSASVGEEKKAQEILAVFVDSYSKKVASDESQIFGLQVQGEGGGEWTVSVEPGKKVFLLKDKPSRPTFYYTLNVDTLRKIHRGELNILTAMGRARASDTAPADIQFMEGFLPSPETLGKILPLTFHFFTLGSPEFIPYGEAYSRFVHGGNMVIFYYEPGLRTAWAQVKKGMVINQDEKDQTNPFPTLVIGIRGKAKAKLGGKVYSLDQKAALFIPAGMPHQFWNEEDEPAECLLIMFGKGA